MYSRAHELPGLEYIIIGIENLAVKYRYYCRRCCVYCNMHVHTHTLHTRARKIEEKKIVDVRRTTPNDIINLIQGGRDPSILPDGR